MQDKISCREGVYKGWKNAIEYLPKAGIVYIELDERPAAELRQVADACRAGGVTPLTIAGGVDACNPEAVARVKTACEASEQIGVRHYFLSAHGQGATAAVARAAAMKSLAEIGEHAAKHGVTLCLETHPPFCTNAAEMLRTMAEVNHPNVRINFDTANVLFYNHG
ncbi:MAG TPA: TIM barrel protein, partial [Planctomycetota bacterium]|nr:TIM barrel protein [Planctomycetota bacterium]